MPHRPAHSRTASRVPGRPPRPRTARLRAVGATLLGAAVLAACSVGGGDPEPAGGQAGDPPARVTLLAHDSFFLPDDVVAAFEEQTGFTLDVRTQGDAGALTNKLVLTEGNPLGDVVFGIDNTFASRAVEAGVLAPATAADLPASAAAYALPGEAGEQLTPVDWGDVCVNVDETWFAERDLDPPATLDDLLDPAYEGLFVTPAASTSSPGFAFLLATVAAYGEDGWQDYWRALMDNDTRVVAGWSDAYEVDFTAGGGGGDRPIVVSYSSSPPFTIPEGGQKPTTRALLDTCFRQVEYAGLLAGADNEPGGQALLDFLVGPEVQRVLPEAMYVYPVDTSVALPPLWSRWAVPAEDPLTVPPETVSEERDDWIRTWSDLTS